MFFDLKSSAYKKYVLGVLLVIYSSNWVDRNALGLVLQDIKVDLDLTDTQLGFLTGIAFALFYSLMGIPIARWADRGNRVTIITVTVALWSATVALCGMAGSFIQLLLIRIGVAVGEAGCVPPAHSLIADYFSRAERPRAVAIYMLGGPISVIVGYFVAGWLNEFYGWRTMFVVLGAPGLILAAVAWLTLIEPRLAKPRRSATPAVPTAPIREIQRPGFFAVFVALWSNVTFRHVLIGFSVTSFFASGIGQWQPAFFMRSYDMKTGELGTWFALVFGIVGLLGVYIGGEIASRHAARREALQLRAIGATYATFGVLAPITYLSTNRYVAFGLLALSILALYSASGPLFATIQSIVAERMRALSIALVYLFANLIGMGLGPLVTGALSDYLQQWAGNESLRYSLLAMCPGYFWGAWHLWHAGKTVERDLVTAERNVSTQIP